MKASAPLYVAIAVSVISGRARADASDPAAARAQLQQGYALRQQGRCSEAIPHFTESIRLDRKPRALLNLADCEEKLGKLTAAQTHFVEARDLAQSQRVSDLRDEAERQLAAIEKKMPKLTVTLAKDAPTGTMVTRDGVELGSISLGVPLPTDPGDHTIVARAAGFQQTVSIAIAEGEAKTIELDPKAGKPADTDRVPVAPARPAAPPMQAEHLASEPVAPAPVAPPGGSEAGSRRAPAGAFVALGAGVVGLAVGTVFLVRSSNKSSQADDICSLPAGACPSSRRDEVTGLDDDAKSAATVATIGFAAGGAALAGGLAWLLLSGRSTSSGGQHAEIRPVVGPAWAGIAGHFQ